MRALLLSLTLAACTGQDLGGPVYGPGRVDVDKADTTNGVPYHGGPVLHHPIAVRLYWGSWWTTDEGQARMAILDGFAADAGRTDWWDITAQYGDAKGTVEGDKLGDGASVTISDSEPGDVVSDKRIRAFVTAHAPAGTQNTNDAIYVVFTPPGTIVSSRWGKSCDAICAYHWHFTGTISSKSRDVKYAVIPSLDCWDGCGIHGVHVNDETTDQMTVALSHELAEAATDPDVTAWHGPHNDGEVGDLCDNGFAADWPSGQVAVQALWSDADADCVDGAR
jgi:hypothetical protein